MFNFSIIVFKDYLVPNFKLGRNVSKTTSPCRATSVLRTPKMAFFSFPAKAEFTCPVLEPEE